MRLSGPRRFETIAALALTALSAVAVDAQQTITGQAAFADWSQQQPGVRRKITVADLPEPKPSESVDNGPTVVPRPKNAWPIAPAGFKVQLYAGGDAAKPMQRADDVQQLTVKTSGTFVMPRIIHTAPNGDLFVADSQAGSVVILRGLTATRWWPARRPARWGSCGAPPGPARPRRSAPMPRIPTIPSALLSIRLGRI